MQWARSAGAIGGRDRRPGPRARSSRPTSAPKRGCRAARPGARKFPGPRSGAWDRRSSRWGPSRSPISPGKRNRLKIVLNIVPVRRLVSRPDGRYFDTPPRPPWQGRVAFLPYCVTTLKAVKPTPYPREPKTVGGHLKRRRHELGLRRKNVALLPQVGDFTVCCREKNETTPAGRCVVCYSINERSSVW